MLEEIFTKAVHQYFNPLAEKYGLKETLSTMDNAISYENDKVRLDIGFDSKRSYELGVNIINKKSNSSHYSDRCFSLCLIIQSRAALDPKAAGEFQTSNPDFIPEAIKTLAYSTETHAVDLLEGNQESFHELATLQEIETRKYNLDKSLWYARQAAEKAWAYKDYNGVIKAYKPLEDKLTLAEKKKLQYAEKKISQ